jgi:hypothetical protein
MAAMGKQAASFASAAKLMSVAISDSEDEDEDEEGESGKQGGRGGGDGGVKAESGKSKKSTKCKWSGRDGGKAGSSSALLGALAKGEDGDGITGLFSEEDGAPECIFCRERAGSTMG